MIDPAAVRKAWDLLNPEERRNAFKVLVLMILGAFASAVIPATSEARPSQ